jgi:hypothetical protein
MQRVKKYKNGDSRLRFQGDISIIKIDKLDVDIEFHEVVDKVIVGLSESHHNHVIVKEREAEVEVGQDKEGYFIRVKSGTAKVVHEKVGGHETQEIGQGLWFFGKQWEYTDSIDRKVVD